MNSKILWLAITSAAVCIGANRASAQGFVSLYPALDNTLYYDTTGALSNGSGGRLWIGRSDAAEYMPRRALMQFDVSSVPPGSIIDSARLDWRLFDEYSAVPCTISIHRVTTAWGEGLSDASGAERDGAPAESDDATWLHALFPGTFWTTPGGDFSPAASDSVVYFGLGNVTWFLSDQARSDIAFWVNNPSSNCGWIFIGDESQLATGKGFQSRQSVSVAGRPLLNIWYTVSTAVNDRQDERPRLFELAQNAPNPFNPRTEISFTLYSPSQVKLTVYDLAGRYVTTLIEGMVTAGEHRVLWDGTNSRGRQVATGVYFYNLRASDFSATQKMVILR